MALTINGTTGIETNTDTGKIKVGASDDLVIEHGGTNSVINNKTGHLDFQVNGTKKMRLSDGGDLQFDDSRKIELGTSQDLQVYHDGTDSYIVNTTGELKITDSSIIRFNTDDFRVYKGDGSELTFRAEGDGGCTLFHDNSGVLETTGSGISVGEMRSQTTYDSTTTNGANMYIHSSPYVIYRSTSSIKYKDNVTTLTDADADKILNCRPVTYTSKCNIDDSNEIHYGLIAEEVKDVDSRLVVFDGTEPENVKYDRFVPHLINLVKRLTDEVNTLKTKVAALEAHTHE